MLEKKNLAAWWHPSKVIIKLDSSLDLANSWNFFKGGMESNENEKQTVLQELKEETSISDAHFIDGISEIN